MFAHYDLAGFSDELGNLGRPVPTSQVIVPEEIWLEDDCIHWRLGNPTLREISRSMLNQFLRLDSAASILRFAREWGVLALSPKLRSKGSSHGYYLPGRQYMELGVEPVSAWLYYSKRARALLNVAAALKQGKLGDLSDWDEFAIFVGPGSSEEALKEVKARMEGLDFGLGFSVLNGLGTTEERLQIAQESVSHEIDNWLCCCKREKVTPIADFSMRWVHEKQRWDFQIDYHGLLFAAIALQLALVIADADSLFTCSGCGIPYVRPRERKRPKAGCSNYCDRCSSDGTSGKRASQNYLKKKKEARQLLSQGRSVSEVAEQVGADPAIVRKWAEKGDKDAKTKTRK